MRRLLIASTLMLGVLAACDRREAAKVAPSTRDLGTGLNNVERTYARTPDQVIPAAQRALQANELQIDSAKRDGLGGEILGHRATGQKVTVVVKSKEAHQTSVSIRVDPGDRNMADLLQDSLARELDSGKPGTP